jgi:hypothetical protein
MSAETHFPGDFSGPRSVQILTARIVLLWDELRAVDTGAAEDLAKAFLSGALGSRRRGEDLTP